MEQKRGPGRPKGSKNKPKPEVVQIPAQCIRCGSDKLLRVPGFDNREENWPGTIHGFRYDKIQWITKRCKACKQVQTVRNYLRNTVEAAEKPVK